MDTKVFSANVFKDKSQSFSNILIGLLWDTQI